MKVHISLNVNDVKKSVEFYEKMLAARPVKFFINKEDTADQSREAVVSNKLRSGYAKFDIANPPLNLVLNEVKYRSGERLSHLGLQVETTEEVLSFRKRWIEESLITVDEMGIICCYAKQDKTWVRDPDGNEWEVFVVLEDRNGVDELGSRDCNNNVSEYVEKLPESCCDSLISSGSFTQPDSEA